MLIDSEILGLIENIEKSREYQHISDYTRKLISRLTANSQKKEVRERYGAYTHSESVVGKYPLDIDGYAKAFDPLLNEEEFYACWSRFGIVVGRDVVSKELRTKAVQRVNELMLTLSRGVCDFAKPETWCHIPHDMSGTPVLSRGFFEVYHDEILGELRQAIRLYIHHAVIWGRANLWTSFDRLGVKLPGHAESKKLPLHVDQNPTVHPNFKTVQGVLALTDCPVERGTYIGVPGSKKYFSEYARMAHTKGEYVELFLPDDIAPMFEKHAQAIPLRAGDIVSWDSRTTHANSENVSGDIRMVAYIAAGPAREDNSELTRARREAFRAGIGENIREALMHASKPPRYTNPEDLARVRNVEKLTLLGKLLYGQESYGAI